MNHRTPIPRTKKTASEYNVRRARQRLLEAAGEVIATVGFDRAMGKDICRRAGLNNAAINYYFGGMEGLCLAVMAEAQERLVALERIQAVVATRKKPNDQLKGLFELLLTAALNPPAGSWVVRVFLQHLVSPSPWLESKKNFLVRAGILRKTVSDIMGLPPDHPAVASSCINVIAPCFLMLFFDKSLIRRAFPGLGLSPENVPALVETMSCHAVAGLHAVARNYFRKNRS